MKSNGFPVEFVPCDEYGVRIVRPKNAPPRPEEELRLSSLWHLLTRFVGLFVASALVLIVVFGQGLSAEVRAKMLIAISAAAFVYIALTLVAANGWRIAVKALALFALACLGLVGLYNLL